jgi:hypothetical protein
MCEQGAAGLVQAGVLPVGQPAAMRPLRERYVNIYFHFFFERNVILMSSKIRIRTKSPIEPAL